MNIVSRNSLKYTSFGQLLKVQAIASVGIKDFVHAINNLPAWFHYYPRIKVLLDLSDTELHISVNDLSYISDCLLNVVLPDNCIRIAEIVNQPDGTALAILFKNIIQDRSQLEFEIFSTRSAALNWLTN